MPTQCNAGSCLVSDVCLDEFKPRHRDVLEMKEPTFGGVRRGKKSSGKFGREIDDVSSELEFLMSARTSEDRGNDGTLKIRNCAKSVGSEKNRQLDDVEADCLQHLDGYKSKHRHGDIASVVLGDGDNNECRDVRGNPLEHITRDTEIANPKRRHGKNLPDQQVQKQSSGQFNFLHWPESKRSNVELGPDHVESDNAGILNKNETNEDPDFTKFENRLPVNKRQTAVDGGDVNAGSGVDITAAHRTGRMAMEHKTVVHGEITRPWTPVFALLEHKYIDQKSNPEIHRIKMAAATETHMNPYSFTAAGDLGNTRDSMLQNELLLRTELGKPKRRGVHIPQGYTYGKPNDKMDGGSCEALCGWPTLSSTTLPFKRKEKTAQRDFMALNRAAVSAGLVNASDQYEFRATHDVRRKTQSEDNQRSRTRRIPPSMVFGISTRPSTPIFDLLEHKYQDKWLQQRRQMELAKRQEENKKRQSGHVYETRASLLRTYQNPVDSDTLWQMPRFTKEAQPSLQTFRSAGARRSAYNHFESDRISRRGTLGHGVFESTKN